MIGLQEFAVPYRKLSYYNVFSREWQEQKPYRRRQTEKYAGGGKKFRRLSMYDRLRVHASAPNCLPSSQPKVSAVPWLLPGMSMG